MKGNALINTDSLRSLERSILVVGSLVLVTGLGLLLTTGLSHFASIESDAKLALTKRQITSLNETISKSKRVKFASSEKKELNVVQAVMDQMAINHHCQLQEVTSTNDTVPLVTRYKKTQDDKGWKQLAITVQVVGTLSNVMAFTRGLSMISIPIELASLDISPIGNERESKVSAKVAFQILKRETSK